MEKLKVGLFGVGLDTYWDQFTDLYNRLNGYQNIIASRISQFDAEVINAGLLDTPSKAIEAAESLKRNNVNIVFLFISTYSLSSTVLPIAQRLKVPVIILNLQPVKAIDYASFNNLNDRGKMTGEWLAHCQACSVPEIASVFNRANIKYEIITGYLDDQESWKEIGQWVEATHVANVVRNHRMGLLGRYYGGMLDVYSDLTKHSVVFGTEFKILEMCELKKFRDSVSKSEVEKKIQEFRTEFDVSPECSGPELERAATTSVALDKLVHEHQLGSMAYYYEGEDGNDYENIVTSVIAGNTLLTGRHIPVAGEYEVKNAQAMKIMDAFGSGGSFSEYYTIDFNDDIVLLGHDGPAHFAIAEGRVMLVPLPVYHGKPGKGLSIQMTVKHGDVTLLAVVEGPDGIFMIVAEGKSVPGPVLQIGNTNSRYKFPLGAKEFINNWSKYGPSHHCAIGLGHISDKIEKLGFLLNIPVKKVC